MCYIAAGAAAAYAAYAAAAIGAYSAYSSSQQQKYNNEYQAEVAENDAKMKEYAAQDAVARGAKAIEESNKKARAMRGAQEVRLASNGLLLGSGSALSQLEDTDVLAAADADTIRYNAAREAWGYKVGQQNDLTSAENFKRAAKNERPWLSAATSLLGSASQSYAGGAGR